MTVVYLSGKMTGLEKDEYKKSLTGQKSFISLVDLLL